MSVVCEGSCEDLSCEDLSEANIVFYKRLFTTFAVLSVYNASLISPSSIFAYLSTLYGSSHYQRGIAVCDSSCSINF
jgi:hypothetical protein